MKQLLTITVYQNSEGMHKHKALFFRVVNVDDSVNIDFQNHIKTLHFLFGSKSIIEFFVSPY